MQGHRSAAMELRMHLGLLLGSKKPKGTDTFLLQEKQGQQRAGDPLSREGTAPLNCSNEERRSGQLGDLRSLTSLSLAATLRQERKLSAMHNKQTEARSPG